MYQVASSVMMLLVVMKTVMAHDSNKCPEGWVLELDPFTGLDRCVEECPAGTVLKWTPYGGGSLNKCFEEGPDGKVLECNRWDKHICAELVKREALDTKMAHKTKRGENCQNPNITSIQLKTTLTALRFAHPTHHHHPTKLCYKSGMFA